MSKWGIFKMIRILRDGEDEVKVFNDVGEGVSIVKKEEDNEKESLLTEKDIELSSEVFAELRGDINSIEEIINKSVGIEKVMGKEERLKVLRQFYRTLEKKPERLVDADTFVYETVPYLLKIMEVYVKIDKEEVKSKAMEEALEETLGTIEELANEVKIEYELFSDKYVEDLNKEINKIDMYLESKRDRREVTRK